MSEGIELTDINGGALFSGVAKLLGYDSTGAAVVVTTDRFQPYAAPVTLMVPVVTTGSYTPGAVLDGNILVMNSSSATTITISAQADVAWPTRAEIRIVRLGAGEVTIAPDTGVTIRSSGSKMRISLQYDAVILTRLDTNLWVLRGERKV